MYLSSETLSSQSVNVIREKLTFYFSKANTIQIAEFQKYNKIAPVWVTNRKSNLTCMPVHTCEVFVPFSWDVCIKTLLKHFNLHNLNQSFTFQKILTSWKMSKPNFNTTTERQKNLRCLRYIKSKWKSPIVRSTNAWRQYYSAHSYLKSEITGKQVSWTFQQHRCRNGKAFYCVCVWSSKVKTQGA